jgi:hypothetical protein
MRAAAGVGVQARDPRTGRAQGGYRLGQPGRAPDPGADRGTARPKPPPGRPQFGLGPIARVTPSPLAERDAASATAMPMGPRVGFGLPNLRRNVCPHFYMTGSRGAIPIQAPHLLKALIRQDANVSRCQLRGGVHLDQGYVNDVCLTPRFNQCVFYEDELTRE